MINLLDWPRPLFFQTRECYANTDDYLQCLLKDIYDSIEGQSVVLISFPQSLNAAYAMAVALYNSPGIYYSEQIDLSMSIEQAMLEYLGFSAEDLGISSAKLMCGLMAYCILYLQANKSMELACFLTQFKRFLLKNSFYLEYGQKNQFKTENIKSIFDSIEGTVERFYSDLTPATQEACDISDRVWRWIAAFSKEDFEYLLVLNDSKELQREMLDMARENFSPCGRFMSREGFQMLVINEDDYLYYSERIENGDFLNMPKNLVRRSDDTSLSRQDTADGASLEDLYQWHYKAMESQTVDYVKLQEQLVEEQTKNEFLKDKMQRDAFALEKIQSLSDKVMRENEQLRADYAQLNEHYENLQIAYNETLDERYGDQEMVSEPDEKEWQLQEAARIEYEEKVADSISYGVKKVVDFCVQYAYNTKNVLEVELNHFKQMIDDLLDSDLATDLQAADQLELYKRVGKINKHREDHLAALEKEKLQGQKEEKAQSLIEHLHVNGKQVIVGGNGEYKNEAINNDTAGNIGSTQDAEG